MKRNRSMVFLAATVLTMVWASAAVAQPAPTVPDDVIKSGTPLTGEQQKRVDAFIGYWMEKLASGSDQEVSQARVELTSQFARGGGDVFHKAYSTKLVRALEPAMGSPRLISRVNTLMVAAQLRDAEVLALVRTGLTDSQDAVRYQAAKTAGALAGKGGLSVEQKRALLQDLIATLNKEKSPHVLQPVLLALPELDLPEAMDQWLDGLDNRVRMLAAEPNVPLGADIEGLGKLLQKLVGMKTAGAAIGNQTMRRVSKVSLRYLSISAQALDANGNGKLLSPSVKADYRKMTGTSDQVLRWAVAAMGAPVAQLPREPSDVTTMENWPLLRLRVQDWNQLLLAPPVSLTAADVGLKLKSESTGTQPTAGQ